MVATVFGDQNTPIARFLDAHAGKLIGVEVVLTVSLGILAIAADRRRALRQFERHQQLATPSQLPIEVDSKSHERREA
jgi:hypothetical protein